jgi:hypothetical protein
MQKKNKEFDSVKMMRDIRDRLSERFKKMGIEEEKRYIRERIKVKSPQEKVIS